MNIFRLSVFAMSMVFSMSSLAAGTMDSGTGSEDTLNRPNSNSSNSNQARDCSIRNGNDKLLCEKEMQNDSERSLRNDNSRINRNNDRNMIDDRISRDAQSRDSEINKSQPLGSSAGDVPLNSNPSSIGTDKPGTGSPSGL